MEISGLRQGFSAGPGNGVENAVFGAVQFTKSYGHNYSCLTGDVTHVTIESTVTKEVGEMDKTTDKKKKTLSQKVEEAFTQVAYAEAGELYSQRQSKKDKKKGRKAPVCVNGETSTGLCV